MIALMPHGTCFLWNPWLTALHVVSDSLVLLAYFSIPLLLFLNRQYIEAQIRPVLLLFAAFIFSCGIGHGLSVWNIWHANYWVEGLWTWVTATISLYTAWQLKAVVPQFLNTHKDLVATHKDLVATRELIEQDPLTGIANRRGLETALAALTYPSADVVHTLVLIDLDGFKDINDTFGHLAGDQLLQTVADVLDRHIRTLDLAARIGGDEFALLMVGCTPEEALTKAETIRQEIQHIRLPDLPHPDDHPLVSASIGLSQFEAGSKLTDSYQEADVALYAAKQGGKNQIRVAAVAA